MSIISDLIEESSITKIIYDANKSSSVLLSGSEIILQGVNENVIKLNALGISYNNAPTSWDTITNNAELLNGDFLNALSPPSNASTLNVYNTLQIQNENETPTKTIKISSDVSGNRIAIDGDYGLPNRVLTSGGTESDIYWGMGCGGSVGTLGDVLQNGNSANINLNMNNYSINNISSISIITPPLSVTCLTDTRLAFPIIINGEIYYIPLFKGDVCVCNN
jgi:hypothetical protein